MITVLIVDDEAELRGELLTLIEKHKEFEIIRECENAYQAIKVINNQHPDVVFLDIKMPEITGLEMLELLDKETLPRIVFVTAFEEHAVEAFRQNALDYLLKPINKEHLEVTLSRLIESHQPQPTISEVILNTPEFIACCHANTDYMIRVDDIIYASTKGLGIVQIITEQTDLTYNTPMTLGRISQLGALKRCHGQNVINTNKILRIEKKTNKTAGIITTHSGHSVDIGKTYMKDFFNNE